MKAIRYGKWIRNTSLALLVVFLSAEQLNFLRSDSIVAVACARELLADKPDELAVVAQYKDAIATTARRHDLPPEFLAAIIYGHQRGLTPFRKFTDCAGSALGRNLSLGLAQVRISTAAANDKLELAELSPATFKSYRAKLLDPAGNIEYQARELRQLLERDHRFPGITAEALVHDPFVMTLAMSEYREGPQAAPSSESRLSGRAFGDLSRLLLEDLYIFDRPAADASQIRTAVTDYLEYINCDSGIFNQSACDDWHKRMM